MGAGEDLAFGGGKAVFYAGRCACFENVKSIAEFSSESVTLTLRKGSVRAAGENLQIERYGGGDLVLRGNVKSVEALEENG